jgi:hypothetical protein
MKKEYINPEMEVVLISTTHQILAGSTPDAGIGEGSVDAGSVESHDSFFDFGEDD